MFCTRKNNTQFNTRGSLVRVLPGSINNKPRKMVRFRVMLVFLLFCSVQQNFAKKSDSRESDESDEKRVESKSKSKQSSNQW